MRSGVAEILTLACHSAACAPPPAGTGGSSRGGASKKGPSAEELDRVLPTDVKAWRPSSDSAKRSTLRSPKPARRRRPVRRGVAEKLRNAMKKTAPKFTGSDLDRILGQDIRSAG
jgi:hypothetical protein